MPNFDLSNYVTTQERILAFWEKYSEGRILTTLASHADDWEACRYRAEVYADRTDALPIATGYAYERAGRGMVNTTSHEENCETSAIGRALANLGFATTHAERPSREEMAKVNRMHEEIEGAANQPPPPARPVRPEPSRLPVTRTQRPATPAQSDEPKGLYYRQGDDLAAFVPPSVSRQHGIATMVQLNAFLQENEFTGGNKGEIISELEGTFNITIKSGRGNNEYGTPDVYPGELYDLAHALIGEQEAAV